MRMKMEAAILFACLLCLAATARSDVVLDQSYVGNQNTSAIFGSDREYSQTFRIGITGSLARLELPTLCVYENPDSTRGDLILRVYSVVEGLPTTEIYQSRIPYGSFTNGLTVDLIDTGITAVVGDELAWSITGTTGNEDYIISGAIVGGGPTHEPGYPYGQCFERFSAYPVWNVYGISFGSFYPIDFFFKTYMLPAVVPEPSSILALLCGIAGIGRLVLRKRT